MPVRNYQKDLIKKLSKDTKYTLLYLQTAFEEVLKDEDFAAFGLALNDVLEAQKLNKNSRNLQNIAEAANISRQQLLRIRNGESSNPTLKSLISILKELNIKISLEAIK